MSDIYTHRDYSFDDEAMSFALHMDRMTAEKLHSKAEIASELAWRDDRIAELEQELTALREYPFEYGQLEARYDIQKKELTALRELNRRAVWLLCDIANDGKNSDGTSFMYSAELGDDEWMQRVNDWCEELTKRNEQ